MERTLSDLSVELAILRKKNRMGFVGPIAGQWIKEQTKLEILTVIETAQQQGVSAHRSCTILVNRPEQFVAFLPARHGQGEGEIAALGRVPNPGVLLGHFGAIAPSGLSFGAPGAGRQGGGGASGTVVHLL
jgi:hypothetical protein